MTATAGRPTERRRPSVVVVGENASTRTGLRLALEGSTDCYEARTADEAGTVNAQASVDVCLVAAERKDMALVAELAAAVPHARIVVLAHDVQESQLLEAVRAGAVGYLSDAVDPSRLPFVVRGVMQGEAAIPRALVSRLVEELRGRSNRRHLLLQSRRTVELTGREWEVLDQLRRKATTKEIAAALGISEVTVRRHVGGLLKKLGVEDRESAAALVDDWTFV